MEVVIAAAEESVHANGATKTVVVAEDGRYHQGDNNYGGGNNLGGLQASPLRALPRRGNTAREEVPGDGHQLCRCRSNRPTMEQLLAFLRAAPDFEFSVVENTHKIITRIHEPTFEWKKCDVQLPLTRSISCMVNLQWSESGSSADYYDVYRVGFCAGEGETEEEMATKRCAGTLGDKGLRGEKVFLSADLNVLLDDGLNITSDNRIRASMPSIKFLMGKGAKVVLANHLAAESNSSAVQITRPPRCATHDAGGPPPR
ncbi:unnamed protein product [Triticum turgidum subsp. durum]|uniref:Phosphoglycerate kinase n=1 Tax=Triticum turgidum subsp. durum TaxID=4567 RepID=A0A9R0XCM8_TRITD|nr:unnamed protein product [Triticum turgidum subsp. durum]